MKASFTYRRVCVFTCTAALVGCSSGSDGGYSAASPEAVARYGAAAPHGTPGLTYQPDVVVVDGGAGVVRSVADDGLTWTLDAAADGLDELDEGEVLFLTSRAAGRVVRKDTTGDVVLVTLAPIQLQEIIRDGRLRFDSAVDAEPLIQEIPGMHGAVSVPEQEDAVKPAAFQVGQPRVSLVDGRAPLPPPARKSELEVNLGQWEVNASRDDKGIAVALSAKPTEFFKAGVEVAFGFKDLRVQGDVAVAGGMQAGPTTMLIHGLEHVEVRVQAGVGQGGSDNNKKVKIEVPAELVNQRFSLYGIPMVLTIKLKIFLETALSGTNSTIVAHGKWGLAGPVGVKSGTGAVPKFRVLKSIMDSIGGIAVGPTGVVFGGEMKLMVGVGVPGAAAGPYAKVKLSAGVANGSALGSPLARCTQADLILMSGGGVGASLSAAAWIAIKGPLEKLKRVTPKLAADLEAEKLWTIKESHQIVPDVPLCNTG